MLITGLPDINGEYPSITPIEIDLDKIRKQGICAFRAKGKETYTIGMSNLWTPAEKYGMDYDAVVARPGICTTLFQYRVGDAYKALLAGRQNLMHITAKVDGKHRDFSAYLRWDFWTMKYVALISSVVEVHENEVFLIEYAKANVPSEQIYMIGWASG